MNTVQEFIPAYTPNPAELARLQPPSAYPVASLGSYALRRYEFALYDNALNDFVANPNDGDPRDMNPQNASEGYVQEEAFDVHQEPMRDIDASYAPYLDEDFYKKHNFEVGTPISAIVRKSAERNPEDGSFVMSKEAYLGLLTDMHNIHITQTAAFNERLPGYYQEHTNGLTANGLGYLVEPFYDKVARADIILDDGFDTLARGGSGRMELNVHNHRSIIVAPIRESEKDTLSHEFTHLLEEREFMWTFGDTPNVYHGIREAVATQIEIVLSNGGNIQDINPNLPDRTREEYVEYRDMLDLICNSGRQPIDVHRVIVALTTRDAALSEALKGSIAENFPDHPNLLIDLDDKLSVMHSAENVADIDQAAAVTQFIKEVRDHYAPIQQKAKGWQRLLHKLPWLAHS